MKIVVEVDDRLIWDATQQAFRATFQGNDRWGTGEGAKELQRQVDHWAKSLDFGPMIERLAPAIIEETVRSALEKAIAREAKRQVDRMKSDGSLGTLFAQND